MFGLDCKKGYFGWVKTRWDYCRDSAGVGYSAGSSDWSGGLYAVASGRVILLFPVELSGNFRLYCRH